MFKGSGPQEVCSQPKPWSVEGDEPAKWAGVGPLRGSDNSHCPFVEGDYNICLTVTSKELQITRRGKTPEDPRT